MDREEQKAWQKAAQYQACIYYLDGIFNQITEAMMIYSGLKLKHRIAELIDIAKEHIKQQYDKPG